MAASPGGNWDETRSRRTTATGVTNLRRFQKHIESPPETVLASPLSVCQASASRTARFFGGGLSRNPLLRLPGPTAAACPSRLACVEEISPPKKGAVRMHTLARILSLTLFRTPILQALQVSDSEGRLGDPGNQLILLCFLTGGSDRRCRSGGKDLPTRDEILPQFPKSFLNLPKSNLTAPLLLIQYCVSTIFTKLLIRNSLGAQGFRPLSKDAIIRARFYFGT